MNRTIAIAGMGWLGQPLAYRLATLGFGVKGTVPTIEKAILLQQNGFEAYPMEISESGIDGEINALLSNSEILVLLIPPGLRKNTGSDYVLKMSHLLAAAKQASVAKIILASSISVYDDSQGKVTENVAPRPQTVAGKQLLQVEDMFSGAPEFQTTIVRFGGLIGGSRQPVKYLAGRMDLADGNAPVNLIHRNDCIRILIEIIKQDAFGTVFNAVNPQHPLKSDYYVQKAKELGLKPPTFAENAPEEVYKQVDSKNLASILGYVFETALV